MPPNPAVNFRRPGRRFDQPEELYGETPKDYAVPAQDFQKPSVLLGEPQGVDELARLGANIAQSPEDIYAKEDPKTVAERIKAQHIEEVKAQHPGTVTDPNLLPPGVQYHIPAPGGDTGAWRDTLSSDEAWIINKESGFNPMARNPDSGAFGLWQGLGSTLTGQASKHGFDPYTTDPNQQLVMFRDYVQGRYGSAAQAVEFWKSHGWY